MEKTTVSKNVSHFHMITSIRSNGKIQRKYLYNQNHSSTIADTDTKVLKPGFALLSSILNMQLFCFIFFLLLFLNKIMKSIFDRPHVWHTADKIPAFFLQQISLLSYKLAVWFSKICMQFTIFIGGQAFCSQPLSQRLKFDVHIQLFFTHWYAAHMHLQSYIFFCFSILL